MHTTYFLVSVIGHRWNVELMKSKIVKVKSLYNFLTHHLPAITEYSIFSGHPIVNIYIYRRPKRVEGNPTLDPRIELKGTLLLILE